MRIDPRNELHIIIGLGQLRICASCFDGKLPATDDALFVNAMMAGLAQTILAGQPQAVLDRFAMGLTEACDCLRREKTDWKN